MLADVSLQDIWEHSVVPVRQILSPGACLGAQKALDPDPLNVDVCATLAAMPIGSMTAILSGKDTPVLSSLPNSSWSSLCPPGSLFRCWLCSSETGTNTRFLVPLHAAGALFCRFSLGKTYKLSGNGDPAAGTD